MAVLENINARFTGNAIHIDPALLKPETSLEVIEKYGSPNLIGILEWFKKEEPTKQDTFFWEEKGSIHSKVKANAAVTGTGGAAVAITIKNDALNYLDSGKVSFPVIKNKVKFKNGAVGIITAKDTSVDGAHVVTVAPYNGNISVGANEEFIVFGNERKRGDVGPDSVFNVPEKKSNNTVILSEGYDLEGSASTLETIAAQIGINGKMTNVIMYAQQRDTFQRFVNYQEAHLLVDDVAVNPSATSIGVRGHRGLLTDVEANGINTTYTIATPSTVLDGIDSMIDGMIQQRTPDEVWLGASTRFRLKFDTAVKDLPGFTNGGILYNSFGNDKEMAVGFGFDSFRRSSYTFHVKTLKAFDHPELLGAPGFKYRDYAVMLPTGLTKDASTGQMKPIIQLRYKAGEFGNRRYWFRLTGGAPGIQNYTSEEDIVRITYWSDMGIQVFKVNQFGTLIGQ